MLLGSALIKGSIIRQELSCETIEIYALPVVSLALEIYTLPVVSLALAKLELTKLG